MLNIENARPSSKQILLNLEMFERFCMGDRQFSPSKFREINEELSISAVLLLGKHRFLRHAEGKRLMWRGLDNTEHDLGYTHDAKVMRDYPGFHAQRSLSLGNNLVVDRKIVPITNGRGNVSIVTMEDGSTGLGFNYRIALRNASLKMHLSPQFNFMSLTDIWGRVWGNA